jgi:phenylacetate-CoA ligase
VAEPWSDAIRGRIESAAGIKAYDVFGMPEILGPGLGAECCHQNGVHVFEDHFYPEIVDPESGDPLDDGQEGELVLTALVKEAMPLIRFRTPDLAAIVPEPCPCGRTMRRIRPIGRRSEEMSSIEGVNVYPSQIEAVLLAGVGTLPPYRIVLTEEEGRDQAEVQIEVTPQIFSDQIGFMEGLQSKLGHEIEHALGIPARVRLVEPRSIERSGAEGKRVVDKRGT